MPYIGNQPAESFTSFATQEFSTSATTSYTLDHAVTNENEIALFINNVRQQPGSGKAYTATGTALTLSAATASTDTMYCVFLGRALQTVTPATNSITAAMVGNDLISGKDALTSSAATTDEFLISDAGTLKRIDAQFFQNTPAFQATNSADQGSMGDNTYTKLVLNTELYDTDSAYDNSSNYRFTPQVAGKYFCYGQVIIVAAGGNDDAKELGLQFYKNGSAVATLVRQSLYNLGYQNSPSINLSAVIDFNGSSDYIELYAKINTVGNGTNSTAAANQNRFGAFKLTGI